MQAPVIRDTGYIFNCTQVACEYGRANKVSVVSPMPRTLVAMDIFSAPHKLVVLVLLFLLDKL